MSLLSFYSAIFLSSTHGEQASMVASIDGDTQKVDREEYFLHEAMKGRNIMTDDLVLYTGLRYGRLPVGFFLVSFRPRSLASSCWNFLFFLRRDTPLKWTQAHIVPVLYSYLLQSGFHRVLPLVATEKDTLQGVWIWFGNIFYWKSIVREDSAKVLERFVEFGISSGALFSHTARTTDLVVR